MTFDSLMLMLLGIGGAFFFIWIIVRFNRSSEEVLALEPISTNPDQFTTNIVAPEDDTEVIAAITAAIKQHTKRK